MKKLWRLGIPALFLGLVLLAACAQAAPAPAKFDVNKFVGTYVGTWTNQKTGATSPVKLQITADETAHTASVVLDFDGNFLGMGDPPQVTVQGTYDDTMAHVKQDTGILGNMDVTIDADGNMNGLVKNIGGGAIPVMTYKGKIGGGRMDADYEVTFKDGSKVTTNVRTQKQ